MLSLHLAWSEAITFLSFILVGSLTHVLVLSSAFCLALKIVRASLIRDAPVRVFEFSLSLTARYRKFSVIAVSGVDKLGLW